jgi:hypothetical protein
VLLVVLSCSAIVILWETSPRYSHPVHFAVLMLASLGLLRISQGFSKGILPLLHGPRRMIELAACSAAIVVSWLLLSVGIFAVARAETSYQFLDPRKMTVQIDGRPAVVQPLHSYSSSWEGAIRLPVGTVLPASIRVSFPQFNAAKWNHLSIILWLPDLPVARKDALPVVCHVGDRDVGVPAAVSGRISRVEIPQKPGDPVMLDISVDSGGQDRTVSGFRVGIGYALPGR